MVIISGVVLAVLTAGSLLIAREYHDRMHAAATLIALVFAMAIAVFYSLGSVVGNYLSRRRAAFKALGKHGLKAVRKEESARIIYKGILRLLEGKLAEAEELLNKALAMTDARQNKLFCIEWLIRIYVEQESEEKILWCYRKASEIAPDLPETQNRLGHAYSIIGRLSNAEYCFNQTLKYDPLNGYAYYSLALIQMRRGEDEKALETLKKLDGIDEGHPLVNAELATWYAMHGDEKTAEEYFDKAILSGFKDPEELSKRMTALRLFNLAEGADGEDLPQYYRLIEKEDADA